LQQFVTRDAHVFKIHARFFRPKIPRQIKGMRRVPQFDVRTLVRIRIQDLRLGQKFVHGSDARDLRCPWKIWLGDHIGDDHFEDFVDEVDVWQRGIRVFAR
jgi:hypothetical protein